MNQENQGEITMEDYQDFARATPLHRMRQMRIWVILVVAGIASGIYGLSVYWSNLHPIVQEMYLVAASWDLERSRLESIEQKIETESSKGVRPEKLIEEKLAILNKMNEFYARLKELYGDCANNASCRLEQFKLRDSIEEFSLRNRGAFIDWFFTTAHASNTDPDQDSIAAKNNKPLAKEFIVKMALIVIGVMYFFSIYKVFFSRNPRNMKVAIDLMKSITGFWFGIVTSTLA
jgi:hypothetical protein